MRLFEEVELGAEVDLELVGERLDLEQLRSLGVTGDQRRGRPQKREVDLHLLDDSGPPDLHHDLPAGLQQREMRLRDRCCRKRLRIDAREDVVAEICADDRVDVRKRHGRHLVDEPAQLLDVDVRQEVGTRRKELAQLDERRAELLQGQAEVARALTRRLSMPAHADLRQDAAEAGALCDPGHRHRATSSAQGVRPRLAS